MTLSTVTEGPSLDKNTGVVRSCITRSSLGPVLVPITADGLCFFLLPNQNKTIGVAPTKTKPSAFAEIAGGKAAFLGTTTSDNAAETTLGDDAVTTPDDGAVMTPDDGAVTTPDDGAVTTPGDGAMTTPDDGAVTTPDDGAVTTPGDGAVTTPAQRTLDMEVHKRKWNLIIQGLKGPANENKSATCKATIDLATTHLRIVNAADSQIAACHRLNNKENAPIIV